MPFSEAAVRQSATGIHVSSTADPGVVSLPAGCQAGNTVTVEIHVLGASQLMDGGMGGRVPAGFEYDAAALTAGSPHLYVLRKPNVAAGEQSWSFSIGLAYYWVWRVTEWTRDLEPVYPLEQRAANYFTGATPTTLTTGTTPQTNRSDLVCLAWHHWERFTADAVTISFAILTSGFTVRDQQRWTSAGGLQGLDCWSWKFVTGAAQYECTADINASVRDAGDVLIGMIVVYAATTYA